MRGGLLKLDWRSVWGTPFAVYIAMGLYEYTSEWAQGWAFGLSTESLAVRLSLGWRTSAARGFHSFGIRSYLKSMIGTDLV
jgi:hypothetical protein